MQQTILWIGYSRSKYEAEKQEWNEYGVTFDFADSVQQAAQKLSYADYSCVAVYSDQISGENIALLYETGATPIVILPAAFSAADRYSCAGWNAARYFQTARRFASAPQGIHDSFCRYLNVPNRRIGPLTIITAQDLCFCLERRTVEVREQRIELTAKEFDIFALLIMDQKRVFTFDMIVEAVWRHDTDFYSRKTVSNHIGNLNRKLKIAPDTPDYIKSVRGVGYKFEV